MELSKSILVHELNQPGLLVSSKLDLDIISTHSCNKTTLSILVLQQHIPLPHIPL